MSDVLNIKLSIMHEKHFIMNLVYKWAYKNIFHTKLTPNVVLFPRKMNEVLINFFLSSCFVCSFFYVKTKAWHYRKHLDFRASIFSRRMLKKYDVLSIIVPQETCKFTQSSYIIINKLYLSRITSISLCET